MRMINKVFIPTIYLMIIFPLDLLFWRTTVKNNALYITDILKMCFKNNLFLFVVNSTLAEVTM